ncbi:MAG: hypothetical protein RIC14_16130 [Filomicrobium sp.]
MPLTHHHKAKALSVKFAGVAFALLAATGSVLWIGNGALESQFETAFSKHKSVDATVVTHVAQEAPIAGSEDFWLGDAHHRNTTPVAWKTTRSLAPGDKVTMAANGTKRILEVIAVKSLNAETVTGTTGSARLMLITLRPENGDNRSDMHILINENDELAPLAKLSEAARAL